MFTTNSLFYCRLGSGHETLRLRGQAQQAQKTCFRFRYRPSQPTNFYNITLFVAFFFRFDISFLSKSLSKLYIGQAYEKV